jgi:acetylornithine deacetylase/succinyl-diaminopimelate desuccinylase-like protein
MSYYQANREAFLEGLKAFLRIPSISPFPENKPDVRRAAEFVRDELTRAGLNKVHLIEGGGNPLVYGEWLGAPGKPTLLIYGHYDVQPPDPLEEWKSPPFEPVVRGDDIFARGASDDKGQTYIHIKAVEGFLKTTGRLPVNVKFLIEGEEEVGGEHISAYVASKPALIQADAAVISDTEMFAPGLPTLCVGLRGINYMELEVQGAGHDLHSGVYGGAAPNPIQAIAEILCALKDRDGHILIPGFYDRVRPPSPEEREAWARLPFDEKAYTQKEMEAKELVGEPEVTLFERLWARPTLEVHGIRGGFTGEGAKTVIPARATAKISTRLVADQDPDEALAQFTAAVAPACPRGVTATVEPIHGARVAHRSIETVHQAGRRGPERGVRNRRSISARRVDSDRRDVDKHLGMPSVLMGFGLPDDNLHAPNEKFHLPNFYNGIEAVAHYFQKLGR